MYFFDLDGTLIDSNGVWKQVDRDFLAKRGIPYSHAYYEGVAHTALPLAAEFTKRSAIWRSPARRSSPNGWRCPGTCTPTFP